MEKTNEGVELQRHVQGELEEEIRLAHDKINSLREELELAVMSAGNMSMSVRSTFLLFQMAGCIYICPQFEIIHRACTKNFKLILRRPPLLRNWSRIQPEFRSLSCR